MFDSNAESKWTEFEASGSIADYLEYKGITVKNNCKGERGSADCKGSCSIGTERG